MIEAITELFEIESGDKSPPSKQQLREFLEKNLTPEHLWFLENELYEYKLLLVPITTAERYTEAFNHPAVAKNIKDSLDFFITNHAENEMKKEVKKISSKGKNRIVEWEVTLTGTETIPSPLPFWDYEKFSLEKRVALFNDRYPPKMGVSGMTYFGYLTMLLDGVHIDDTVPDFKYNNQIALSTGTILNGSINQKSKTIPAAEAYEMQSNKPLYWITPREKDYVGDYLHFRPCIRLQYK